MRTTIVKVAILLTVRYVLSFLAIAGVLLLGNWIWSEVQARRASRSELSDLHQLWNEINTYRKEAEKRLIARTTSFEKQSIDLLDGRLAMVEEEIRRKRAEDDERLGLTGFPLGARIVEGFKRKVDIELLFQEQAYLRQIRNYAVSIRDRDSGLSELERRRKSHEGIYRDLEKNFSTQRRLRDESPVLCRILATPCYQQLQELRRAAHKLFDENVAAHEKYLEQKQSMERSGAPKLAEGFKVARQRIDGQVRPILDAIDERHGRLSRNWIEVAAGLVGEVAPTAAVVLLSAILTPVGIKIAFYFLLAPIASRQRAICLLPSASGVVEVAKDTGVYPSTDARAVTISRTIEIHKDEEILVLPEFLQSSPIQVLKATKWLLDCSRPITSIGAGAVALTRIRTNDRAAVVVSATKDPLIELEVIRVSAGGALVLRPSSLVGIVTPRDQPLRIESYWRIFSLHAWLTLQFRYLIFFGPASLILSGCRGVKLEDAESGRMIGQDLTLGFSANTLYSTVRCETFSAYLMGEEALFKDRFSGSTGCYIYEEIPNRGKRSGITGRGLEGVLDSMLKAFGI